MPDPANAPVSSFTSPLQELHLLASAQVAVTPDQDVLGEVPYQSMRHQVLSAPGKQTLKSCFSPNASVSPQIWG